MTNKTLSRLLGAEIEQQLAENQDVFERFLHRALSDNCEIDPAMMGLLRETVRYTAQFSVQFVFRTLEKENIIDLLEEGAPVLYPLDRT